MEDNDSKKDPPETTAGIACLVRCIQEERQARCRKIREETELLVQEIKDDGFTRTEELLLAGRAGFVDITSQINASVVHPARREADAIAARQLGEGVDGAIDDCRNKLREFSRSDRFEPVLQSLILVAAACAKQLLGEDDKQPLGEICVSPGDVETCRKVVKKNKLSLTVREDENIWGGAVIKTPGGEHHIHNTLNTRMQKKEYELRAVATRIIHKAFNENESSDEQS